MEFLTPQIALALLLVIPLVAAGLIPIVVKLEPLGATFAAIASSLWIVNSMFTLGYMRGNKEKNQTRFFGCVAVAIAAAMGIAASANLITLFIFYEALTISTFPLVTHKGDAKAKRGGTIYALIRHIFVGDLDAIVPFCLWNR